MFKGSKTAHFFIQFSAEIVDNLPLYFLEC